MNDSINMAGNFRSPFSWTSRVSRQPRRSNWHPSGGLDPEWFRRRQNQQGFPYFHILTRRESATKLSDVRRYNRHSRTGVLEACGHAQIRASND